MSFRIHQINFIDSNIIFKVRYPENLQCIIHVCVTENEVQTHSAPGLNDPHPPTPPSHHENLLTIPSRAIMQCKFLNILYALNMRHIRIRYITAWRIKLVASNVLTACQSNSQQNERSVSYRLSVRIHRFV